MKERLESQIKPLFEEHCRNREEEREREKGRQGERERKTERKREIILREQVFR